MLLWCGAVAPGVTACWADRTPSTSDLARRLDDIFDAPRWREARWGVLVVDSATSLTLYERDPDKAVMPASNLKLLTTAAALDLLGPDFQFETRICCRGEVTSDGTLKGDLILQGSGDPSISGRYARLWLTDAEASAPEALLADDATTSILRGWAEAVSRAGIHRIEGAVVGDGRAFQGSPRAGSWQLDYYPEWYAAESSGLAINENCWDVVITPGARPGAPALVHDALDTRFVTFRNNIVTTSPARMEADGDDAASPEPAAQGPRPSRPAVPARAPAAGDGLALEPTAAWLPSPWPDPTIHISRDLDGSAVELSGTIAINHPPFREWGSVHDGSLFAATLMAEELSRLGIPSSGGARGAGDSLEATWQDRQAPLRVLHVHKSPPLRRIVKVVNKPSQNFYADMLAKAVGARATAAPGSFSAGERAVRQFLASAGVPKESVAALRMVDGSGLSRQDLVTPRMIVAALCRMDRSPRPGVAEAFRDSLPVMGRDGTLRTRLRGTAAEATVIAKTGTISGVRSLSGYLTTASGRRVAFCMIANNFSAPTKVATRAQDEALLALISSGTSPDSRTTSSLSSSGQ